MHAQTGGSQGETDSLEVESRNLAAAKGGSKKEGGKGAEGECVEEAEDKLGCAEGGLDSTHEPGGIQTLGVRSWSAMPGD